MFQKKSKHIKSYRQKTLLDSVLWFVENYLPQKKKKSSYDEFNFDNLETDIINKFKKLASARTKSLRGDLVNSKVTFTIGHWALPYLNFLKRIKLFK